MRKCLVVIGMHRSGTSLMAGLLKIFGAYLGEDLLGANKENEMGHFENKKIVRLNERILKGLGGGWDNLDNLDFDFNDKKIRVLTNELKEVINSQFKNKNLFCIKDPRISLLIPLYKKIFKDIGVEPCFVVMDRKYIEIAESLKKRNGFSFTKSIGLYKKYNFAISESLPNIKSILINFDAVIKNVDKYHLSLQKNFGIKFKNFNKISKDVGEFVSPELKHYNLTYEQEVMHLDGMVNDKNLEIMKRDLKIGELDIAINNNMNKIGGLMNELSRIENENNHLQNKIGDIENSLTWSTLQKLDWLIRPLLMDTKIVKKKNRGSIFRKNIKEFETVSIQSLSKMKVAVVFHCFYEDLFDEISEQIMNIPINFDLYINLVEGHSEDILKRIKDKFPNAIVTISKNRGYDIGGLINLLNNHDLSKYDLVCKIHTKKSEYRKDGLIWGKKLVNSILGSEKQVVSILSRFHKNSNLGIIGSDEFLDTVNIGSNQFNYSKYCDQLGISHPDRDLKYISGSMFWCRPEILESVKDLNLKVSDFEHPNKLDGQKAHAIERLFGAIVRNLNYEIGGASNTYEKMDKIPFEKNFIGKVKPICFYLPQYHVIPENEKWWGRGFTEWDNVKKGKPLFKDHYQPRIPGELGYYDLSSIEIAERQAKLAKENGIYGFCYYYYSFGDKKLLDMPIKRMLETKKPDFPFCICWANENWTRSWDGLNEDILVEQKFTTENYRKLIRELVPYFKDKRYIRVNSRPLILIYRIDQLDPKLLIDTLRNEANKFGIDLYISFVQSFSKEDPIKYGFDSAVEFPPSKPEIPSSKKLVSNLSKKFDGEIFDYNKIFEKYSKSNGKDYKLFFGVTPGWDNTVRRKNDPAILIRSDPINYMKWLQHAIGKTKKYYKGDERLVFINAWNEWGEGCYLEPDSKYGDGYLKATKQVIDRNHLLR